jgi:hypothetical protein
VCHPRDSEALPGAQVSHEVVVLPVAQAYRKLAMKHHPDKNPANRAAAEKKVRERRRWRPTGGGQGRARRRTPPRRGLSS